MFHRTPVVIIVGLALLTSACDRSDDHVASESSRVVDPPAAQTTAQHESPPNDSGNSIRAQSDSGEDLVEPPTSMIEAEWGARYKVITEETALLIGDTSDRLFLVNDSRRRHQAGDEKHLHRLGVYDADSSELLNGGFWTTHYPTGVEPYDSYQQLATSISEALGRWNGYFYTHDLNGNEREEIIGMQLSGAAFVPAIYEYHDGEFRSVLPHAERGAMTLGLEVPGPGVFVVYEVDYEDPDRSQYVRFEYRWNDQEVVYELVDRHIVPELPNEIWE